MTARPLPRSVGTVEEMIDHFSGVGEPTGDELTAAVSRLGRNAGPPLLADLLAEYLLTASAAAAVIGDVWSMAEYPDHYLAHDRWRELFALAGYTRNGKGAARPTNAITLYRGSVPERRADWSWTDQLSVAVGYASGTRAQRPLGKVWSAEVEPWRLLARNDGPSGRNESEYVVDTDELVIVEHATITG